MFEKQWPNFELCSKVNGQALNLFEKTISFNNIKIYSQAKGLRSQSRFGHD